MLIYLFSIVKFAHRILILIFALNKKTTLQGVKSSMVEDSFLFWNRYVNELKTLYSILQGNKENNNAIFQGSI